MSVDAAADTTSSSSMTFAIPSLQVDRASMASANRTECVDRTVTRPSRSGPSRVTCIGEAKPHREAFPGSRQVRGKTRLVDLSVGQTAQGFFSRLLSLTGWSIAMRAGLPGNWRVYPLTVGVMQQRIRAPAPPDRH